VPAPTGPQGSATTATKNNETSAQNVVIAVLRDKPCHVSSFCHSTNALRTTTHAQKQTIKTKSKQTEQRATTNQRNGAHSLRFCVNGASRRIHRVSRRRRTAIVQRQVTLGVLGVVASRRSARAKNKTRATTCVNPPDCAAPPRGCRTSQQRLDTRAQCTYDAQTRIAAQDNRTATNSEEREKKKTVCTRAR
jgi:hypothetical protein